jgi:hypothetical protein
MVKFDSLMGIDVFFNMFAAPKPGLTGKEKFSNKDR